MSLRVIAKLIEVILVYKILVFIQRPTTVVIAIDALFTRKSHRITFVVCYFSYVCTFSTLFLNTKA